MEKTVRIKGMVCRRCIETVKEVFMEKDFNVLKISLGEVVCEPQAEHASLEKVAQRLVEEGFELLDDKQSRIISRVKELVEEHLSGPEHSSHTFSEMVSDALHIDYNTVSSLFSGTEGITLEHYLISQRVEKVKQLLQSTNLSLTDIAFQLNYSSVHHLSNQFKKTTGLSPSQYREWQMGKS